MTSTFAARINAFNSSLQIDGSLPEGIAVLNPFRDNDCATPASEAFYQKFYNDNRKRFAILGINPGRFGAGLTGVPFTDPTRLAKCCHIHVPACPAAHEPSSEYVYEVIQAYGGVQEFYSQWYINSICPLGFTRLAPSGRWINCNYYDYAALKNVALPFIVKTLRQQIACGLRTEICFCLGKDKNTAFLVKLNAEYKFFGEIVGLDHPRFIIQYRRAQMADYVRHYVEAFHAALKRFAGNP